MFGNKMIEHRFCRMALTFRQPLLGVHNLAHGLPPFLAQCCLSACICDLFLLQHARYQLGILRQD